MRDMGLASAPSGGPQPHDSSHEGGVTDVDAMSSCMTSGASWLVWLMASLLGILGSWLRCLAHCFAALFMAWFLGSWLHCLTHGFVAWLMTSMLGSWLCFLDHGHAAWLIASLLGSCLCCLDHGFVT